MEQETSRAPHPNVLSTPGGDLRQGTRLSDLSKREGQAAITFAPDLVLTLPYGRTVSAAM
jgi:hypothetical protein